LTLTDAGREMATRIGHQRRDFYSFLLEGLSDEDRRKLDELLLHLAVRMEKYDPDMAEDLPRAG
jgi:DNA-binding MarR family transcriptional regulator